MTLDVCWPVWSGDLAWRSKRAGGLIFREVCGITLAVIAGFEEVVSKNK